MGGRRRRRRAPSWMPRAMITCEYQLKWCKCYLNCSEIKRNDIKSITIIAYEDLPASRWPPRTCQPVDSSPEPSSRQIPPPNPPGGWQIFFGRQKKKRMQFAKPRFCFRGVPNVIDFGMVFACKIKENLCFAYKNHAKMNDFCNTSYAKPWFSDLPLFFFFLALCPAKPKKNNRFHESLGFAP